MLVLDIDVLKKGSMNKLNVDTTMQEKAINFPTDAILYHRMRKKPASRQACWWIIKRTWCKALLELLHEKIEVFLKKETFSGTTIYSYLF
jgi:hypothetical protein